jgi:hypothetical protein
LEKYSESSSSVVERDALRKMVLLRWSVGQTQICWFWLPVCLLGGCGASLPSGTAELNP